VLTRAIRSSIPLVAAVWLVGGEPVIPGHAAFGQQPDALADTMTIPTPHTLVDREELAARLDRLIEDPALVRAHVGLTVQIAETGEVLFERNGEKRFTPASNTKLVTSAVGLAVLGAGHRWTTTLIADGPVNDGVLQGDLWIVGTGDPWLTREDVAAWPGILADAGIRQIEGEIVGDDSAFPVPQHGVGWMWDDLYVYYSAGVSALQLSPNRVRARLEPGAALGTGAVLAYRDAGPELPIVNRVRTGAPGSDVRLQFLPPPEGGDVELTGWIPLGGEPVDLSMATHHPTLYLLEYVEDVFAEAGITSGGARRASPGETPAATSWQAELGSDSLGAVLAELLKPSDNQMAETLILTLGREAGDGGTWENGLAIVDETLAGWGIEPGAIDLVDGSGLSRYNEVTPNGINRMLRAMWRHPDFGVFYAGLPVAGVDGTLRRRMTGMPPQDNVRAKTGSLSSVRALSGYLTAGDGQTLVFSLLLNGYDAPGDVAVALEDLLVEQLSLYRRPVVPGWPSIRGAGRP
jgi:serine-type D-Ala-D-Ala carboxypeptidase/endopeptidase (penicillin-binding protein 4)